MKYFALLQEAGLEELAGFIAVYIMQFSKKIAEVRAQEPGLTDDELFARLMYTVCQKLQAEAAPAVVERVLGKAEEQQS